MANTATWPQHPPEGRTERMTKGVRKNTRRALKGLMRSHSFQIPKYDLPLRIRWVRTLSVTSRLSAVG